MNVIFLHDPDTGGGHIWVAGYDALCGVAPEVQILMHLLTSDLKCVTLECNLFLPMKV